MSSPPPALPPEGTARRIDLLDALRGGALIAMASYHFTWDLEFFRYVDAGTTGAGLWRLYARAIASSFLFMVGLSLVLAHWRGIRWRPFAIRLAQVAAGAAAITGATVFVTPNAFVFFGILHEIAAASVLGLAFLRLPPAVTAAAAAAVLAAARLVETPLTNPKALAWIGLAERPPVSNDYVPLFPWFGAVLLGIAAARFAVGRGWPQRLAGLNGAIGRRRPLAGLAWLGRHSLAFYLLHQPILIGLVWCIAAVAPPNPVAVLSGECRRSCAIEEDAALCRRFCGCVVGKIGEAGLTRALIDDLTTAEENERVRGMIAQCSIPPPPPPSP